MTSARTRRGGIALAAAVVAACLAGWFVACAGPSDRRPTPGHVPAVWRDVRASAGHTAHVGKHAVPCRDCHGDRGFPVPPADLCTRCHPAVRATIHPVDPLGKAVTPACRDCHGFGAESAVAPANCLRCHAEPAGKHTAVGAHRDLPCGDCHKAHGTPTLDPKPCAGCHAAPDPLAAQNPLAVPNLLAAQNPLAVPNLLAAPNPLAAQALPAAPNHHGGARSCFDCHRMHEPEVVPCVTCHARQPGKLAVGDRAISAGHALCTGCHAQQAAPFGAPGCTRCHASQRVLAPDKHTSCLGCHQQHAADVPKSCLDCHAQRTAHPAANHGGTVASCIGCHPPHALAAGERAVACTSCHAKPHHATANCVDCHAPHGPGALRPRVDAALCGTCHAQKVRGAWGTGHATCAQCHTSVAHEPSRPVPSCATCHAAKAAAVRAGHSDCTSCHTAGPHQPVAPAAACATCHAREARTAPSGHAACAACHEPHSGVRRPDKPCASCHADKASQGHGARLDCASCHRPHGPGGPPKPPPCTSCHTAERRPGLHQVAAHGNCVDCHGSHQQRPADGRATCVRCHTAQVDHEPTAVRCGACHPFATGAPASRNPFRTGAADHRAGAFAPAWQRQLTHLMLRLVRDRAPTGEISAACAASFAGARTSCAKLARRTSPAPARGLRDGGV